MSSANKHTFKAVSSAGGVIQQVVSTACANCHGPSAFTIDPDGWQLEAKKEGYFAAIAVIKAQLATRGIVYDGTKSPYFFKPDGSKYTNWFVSAASPNIQGADLMGAAFNLRLLDSDAGWVHSGTYAKRILFDTISYLSVGAPIPTTPVATVTSTYTTAVNAAAVDQTTKNRLLTGITVGSHFYPAYLPSRP